MRLDKPRILPMAPDEWDEEAKSALQTVTGKGGKALNIFTTMARRPKALKAFLQWGSYVLQETEFSPREREILILRTGYRCKSGYEFHQHTRIGLNSGLSEADIKILSSTLTSEGSLSELAEGSFSETAEGSFSETAEGSLSTAEVLLMAAADELYEDGFITDKIWTALSEHYNEGQLMDLVFVVAQYTQVSMLLNTFGVQLENKSA